MATDTDPSDDGIDHPDDTHGEPVPLGHVDLTDATHVPPAIREDPIWAQGYRTALGEWYATKQRRRKRKKLAKRGYVEWHLVDGSYPEPELIRPRLDGGGVPYIVRDGQRYLFPEQAALPSERSGMRTFVHKRGEMTPINLRDPADHAIAPDQFQEYAQKELQTDQPGWLSNLDLSAGDVLFYGLIGIIIAAVGYSFLTGGMPA